MRYSSFRKKYPRIPGNYPEEELDNYERKFPVFIGSGIAVFVGDMALMLLLKGFRVPQDLAMGIFLMIDSVGTGLLVYSLIQKVKYDIEDYNKANHLTEEEKRRDKIEEYQEIVFFAIAVIGVIICCYLERLDKSWGMLLGAMLICIIAEKIVIRDKKINDRDKEKGLF